MKNSSPNFTVNIFPQQYFLLTHTDIDLGLTVITFDNSGTSIIKKSYYSHLCIIPTGFCPILENNLGLD